MYQSKHVRSFKAELSPSAPVKEIGTTSAAALTVPIQNRKRLGLLRASRIVLVKRFTDLIRYCKQVVIPGMIVMSPVPLFGLLAGIGTWFLFPWNVGEFRLPPMILFSGCGALAGIAFAFRVWEPFLTEILALSQQEIEKQ